MAQPKKKMTSTRSGNRRGQLRLRSTSLTSCPQCHATIKPHTVCYVCGTYRGQKVLNLDKKKAEQTPTDETKKE